MTIEVGTRVVCPVTDAQGEAAHAIGTLVAINCRMATVDLGDRTVKVGKTKIEAAAEEKPKKATTGAYAATLNCRTSKGRKSRDCADAVALMLRGKDLDESYLIAARYLDRPQGDLEIRYSKLNNGQQRMCLGNLIRGKMMKES